MQKITPCVWYDRDALDAAELYVSAFEGGRVLDMTRYADDDQSPCKMPAGTPHTIRLTLCGQEFIVFNGGTLYKPTPALSFFVGCENAGQLDTLWDRLSAGGSVLMEVGKYPFSERFGWLADKFGVSWQISLSGLEQKITPYLMFTGQVWGKAEEAIRFYSDAFGGKAEPNIVFYGKEAGNDEGSVMFANFQLAGQGFMAADSSFPHGFTFTEGTSFAVSCVGQSEADRMTAKLSEGGELQPYGWLKDKYGVSWQIAKE